MTTRIYGQWAGNEKSVPEDKTRCIIKEVFSSERGGFSAYICRQCRRKRGYGKDGLYCKQHAALLMAVDEMDKENQII